MPTPSPQRYRSAGEKAAVDKVVLNNALSAINRIRGYDSRITPILTLRHLAHLIDVPFGNLRRLVARRTPDCYKVFYLKKRIPGRSRMRMICVPSRELMSLQRWLVENVLRFTKPHEASHAFHPECRSIDAAQVHCGCKWLLKVDIQDFFHSISERRVQRIFEFQGFTKLLSFELARLVTFVFEHAGSSPDASKRWPAIPYYLNPNEGVLPQGAPTSPMLANLAMIELDEILSLLAKAKNVKYTRYADDLAFSGGAEHDISSMRQFRRAVLNELNVAGFRPNLRKTVIRGPGSRRIVLGILVDTLQPRLTSEFKENINLHLHYLRSSKHGPAIHAQSRGNSISGIFHHLRGLIAWAEIVEPPFGGQALKAFNSVQWPPIQLRDFN